MVVEKARISDIEAIMAIEEESFVKDVQEVRKTFEERLSCFGDGFVVLKDENAVIGYFCSELWESLLDVEKKLTLNHSITESHNHAGEILYISSFAILTKYRGKNLGKTFFYDAIAKICQGLPQITQLALLVSENWKNAIKIYMQYGFKIKNVIKDFFVSGNGCPANGLFMVKNNEEVSQ